MASTTITVIHHSIPQGPYKLRPVCDLVRGMPVVDAMTVLKLTPRAAAVTIAKKLQATAAAAVDKSMNPNNLVIAMIRADQQMELKRQRIRSRGRAAIMRKRSSSLTIQLAELPVATKPAASARATRSSNGPKN